MSTYIEHIKDLATNAAVKNKTKSISVNKQSLAESINLSKKKLENFISCIGDMPKTYRTGLADRIFDLSSQKKTNVGCAEYIDMAKAVAGNDLRVYFSTFEICANNFIEILDKVLSNINKIFDNNDVKLNNITLSQLTVFSMMEQASIFANFCVYLLDMVSHDVLSHDNVRELSNMPQYKIMHIQKHKNLVYELALQLKTGAVNYMSNIDKVQKSSSNVKLVTNDGTSNVGLIDPDEHTLNPFLRRASFNPFFLIGEYWVIVKHWIYQSNIKEKEYIESHVALLKMELDGVNPDTPEYQHHVKVIDAYNKMLSELDEKISKYENS